MDRMNSTSNRRILAIWLRGIENELNLFSGKRFERKQIFPQAQTHDALSLAVRTTASFSSSSFTSTSTRCDGAIDSVLPTMSG